MSSKNESYIDDIKYIHKRENARAEFVFLYSMFQFLGIPKKVVPPTIIFVQGQVGRVVTLSPPTSEIGVLFLARPQVGKLVVAYHWSAFYSTET